jgi:DNA topoisomerase-1
LKNVVVVESPAKARTINRYLGSDYTVLASYGHVRDLPSKDGSVKPDEDFAMLWDVDARAAKRISEIAEAAKGADKIILATDPDREGEAISWHLLEVLQKRRVIKDAKVERVTFNAITRAAVTEAMKNPRDIDMELVEAYLARRALDYLVGFTLSPVLWRKLPGARSAGRVQSVALRLVVDREIEIEAFRTQEYWTVEADVTAGGSDPFLARLAKHRGKRLTKFDLGNEASANAAKAAVEQASFKISAVEKRPARRTPPPPFTTSTLQQEAARKLGFATQRTMQAAQKLYEGVDIGGETVGLITYMRTDGVASAPEALVEAREVIAGIYGAPYVPAETRYYRVKAKNAQEAHEAIRPTSLGRNPGSLRLEPDLGRLYELIWKRMIASQMEGARIERTTIDIDSADGQTGLRATGQVVLFDGYLRVYEEGRDDPDNNSAADADSDERQFAGRLPAVSEGDVAETKAVRADQHFTEPPPRYSEASLVKRMEELGIGRPSTYASILTVLRDRTYVRMDKGRFVPEDKGRLVTAFLEQFFRRYVEYDFTAGLEEKLDLVSAGELDWKALLREFWQAFHGAVGEIGELRMGQVIEALNEALGPHIFPDKGDGADPRACPTCGTGRLSLKTGRYGAFVGCSNYPECRYTRPIAQEGGEDGEAGGDRELGVDPANGHTIWLKAGRFGPYVEDQGGETPKRASLPKDWPPAAVDLDKAIRLLRLPREVGAHPEDGKTIMAGIGRYGPYVQHDKLYANLPTTEEVFDIGLNRAVTVLAEKRAGGPRRGGAGGATALKELGAHPRDGEPVRVLAGRYGPYIKHGATNANVPKGANPEALTMDEAVKLLAEREAKGPSKGKRPVRSAAPAKASAGKAKTARKPAAKKKAPAKKAKS